MKQKLLITGSCGFIMSNLIRKVIYENKYEVVSLDRISKASLMNNIYVNKSHQFYPADITDEHIVNRIFEYEKPDVVIHAAAETFVDDSLKDPNKFINSNVLGTQILVNSAIKWGVKKFVYISTDEVYGQLEKETDPLWNEQSPINPRNPYSASKASGELVVKAASASFGLDYCITRSCNNYGPRQTGEKFIPKIIKCILDEKKIPVYGRGLQMRDWLHVFDNCSAIMKVLESGKSKEIYNISSNQEFSNIEVVYEICKALGKGLELVEFVKDRAGHDFRYGVDSSKLKELGWDSKYKFKAGLNQTIEWYVQNKFFLT